MVCSGEIDRPAVEADQDSFRVREVADDPPQGRRELLDQGGDGHDLVGAGQLGGLHEVDHLDGVAPLDVLLANPPEVVDRRQRPGRLAGHVEAKLYAFARHPGRAIRLLDGLLIPFHGWTVLPRLPSAGLRSTLRVAAIRASSRANPPSLEVLPLDGPPQLLLLGLELRSEGVDLCPDRGAALDHPPLPLLSLVLALSRLGLIADHPGLAGRPDQDPVRAVVDVDQLDPLVRQAELADLVR